MINDKWAVLVSPEAQVSETAQDAASKGLLSAGEAEAWIVADEWAADNFDDLRLKFPGKSVAVVYDAAQNEIGTYVGETDPEAIELVRQFVSAPWVLVSGTPFHGDLTQEGLPEAISDAFATVEEGLGELTDASDEDAVGLLGEAAEALEILLAGTPGTIMIGNRPFVIGTFTAGTKKVVKLYLIDTGASISAISEANFKKIMAGGGKLKPAGSKKIITAGGAKEVKFYEGKMSFTRDKADGSGVEKVDCDIPVAVVTSDILGMDQIKKTGTIVGFDPSSGDVRLTGRPKPKPKNKTK